MTQNPTAASKDADTDRGHLRVIRSGENPKHTLALIDDDEAILMYLRTYLEQRGFGVRAYQSAEAALRAFEDKMHCDLVLVDFRMPAANGLEITKKLRAKFPAVPVVLMTAYASIEGAVAAMREGASDYIEKPVSLDKLDAVITKFLPPLQ